MSYASIVAQHDSNQTKKKGNSNTGGIKRVPPTKETGVHKMARGALNPIVVPPGGHKPFKPSKRGMETDAHRLKQRQKQINLGKKTPGYIEYKERVPLKERDSRTDPWTPDITQKCSKRSWDGQLRKWRKMLHQWDPVDQALIEEAEALEAEEVAAGPPDEAEEVEGFRDVSDRPLPPVVEVVVASTDLMNVEGDSLLGQWEEAKSKDGLSKDGLAMMELQGESCEPFSVAEKESAANLIYVPLQW